MNLEEARKVIWFKNNPRPIGELLDESRLNRGDLEWAAKNAFHPNIKEASRVLLEHIHQSKKSNVSPASPPPAFDLGLSLEQARATLWPMPPHKGEPMGPLVDTRELTLKDLGYAVENAWDEKVRKAAMALSLSRMGQLVSEPPPPAGYLQIVSSGRSYAQRQESRLTLIYGILLGLVLSIMLASLIWMVINLFTPHPGAKPVTELWSNPNLLFGLLIFIAIVILVLWLGGKLFDWAADRLNQQIEEHRRGQEGEERAVRMIVQALDGNWSLFRNLGLPGRNKGDLDLVLVGPPGVWALEVKNFNGAYRNTGDAWEYQRGNKWLRSDSNPGRQARDNAARLGTFLKADHINTFVNAAVVWANDETPPLLDNPATSVWLCNRLPDELGNIWQGEKLSKDQREKINQKLNRLCDQQKNSKS